MTANEIIVVARLANHYEDAGMVEQDPLEVAEYDFKKLKKEAPEVWKQLRDSNLSDREIGDWLWLFYGEWSKSGKSFRNFAADKVDEGLDL